MVLDLQILFSLAPTPKPLIERSNKSVVMRKEEIKMALVTSIISAIGNNNSLAPLIVRDCGIENPVKVAMTYRQNKSNKEIAYLATRERVVDEYSVSTV